MVLVFICVVPAFSMTRQELEEVVKRVEQGDPEAQNTLGDAYCGDFYCEGLDKDYAKAYALYLKAAAQNYAPALINLGNMCHNGHHVKQNDSDAERWYLKAAELGDPMALDTLGCFYGFFNDHEKAMQYFLKAAEKGYAPSCNNIGNMYYYGDGVQKDYKKAFEWYYKSAEQNNPRAQFNLGFLYENGKGIEQSYENAFKWYSKAAEQDDSSACSHIANMYYNGRGLKLDYEKALIWYLKAAELNTSDINLQITVATMYSGGKGTKRNEAEAFKWFFRAAQQGDAIAQNIIGNRYADGNGVKQNYQEAVKWWELSAKQGNKSAKASLEAYRSDPVKETIDSEQKTQSGAILSGLIIGGLAYLLSNGNDERAEPNNDNQIDHDPAEYTRSVCGACYGDGKCRACDATGFMTTGSILKNRWGTDYWEDVKEQCYHCDATGKCPKCNGVGYLNSYGKPSKGIEPAFSGRYYR